MTSTLTLDRIKSAARGRRLTHVEFELGGEAWSFYVKQLTESERCIMEAQMTSSEGSLIPDYSTKARLIPIVHMVCDERGNRLFKAADVEALAEAEAGLIARLFAAVEDECSFLGASNLKKRSVSLSEASDSSSSSDFA